MTKDEIIKRLCDLSTKIGNVVFEEQIPHDCFCGEKESDNFQFDETILEFIESAVNNRIDNLLKKGII